jgi:hypothetical protein
MMAMSMAVAVAVAETNVKSWWHLDGHQQN